MSDGTIVIETELKTKTFEKQIKEVEYRLKELDYELSHSKELKLSDRTIKEYEIEVEKLSNRLYELKSKELKLIEKDGFSNISAQLDNIGKSMVGVTKKVTRWALAVFGVRGAYMFVRNAINTITQDDAQLKTDIEFMRKALAYTIEPIVRTIVSLAKTLMQYIAYIVKAWTGRDIFASASKNLKSANKSAKALQKTSASFDKFNKLSSNKGGGGGITTPSVKGLEGKVPEWLDWIAKNKDIVTAGLIAIASGLVAVKLGLTAIQGFGLGLALYGIMTTILNIIKFLKDPTFNNFINILKSIALAVAGVAIMFANWPVAIGAVIAWVVLKLLECYDKVVGIFDKILNWLENDFVNKLHYLFGSIGDIIAMPFIYAVTLAKSLFESLFGGVKKIINGIVKMFKGDFLGGIKSVFSGLKDILLAPFNALISIINATIKGINRLTGANIPLINFNQKSNSMGGRAKGGIYYPKLAQGGIVNMPGKGVQYHGATIAERGAEAVVPLTDNAQMELLGESIGKHIKVNVDFTAEIEGRVFARVMKEINAENKFARNGGL